MTLRTSTLEPLTFEDFHTIIGDLYEQMNVPPDNMVEVGVKIVTEADRLEEKIKGKMEPTEGGIELLENIQPGNLDIRVSIEELGGKSLFLDVQRVTYDRRGDDGVMNTYIWEPSVRLSGDTKGIELEIPERDGKSNVRPEGSRHLGAVVGDVGIVQYEPAACEPA